MTQYEINKRLDACYKELYEVKAMTESQVCENYNADEKAEIICLIEEEIADLENRLEILKEQDEDDYDIWDDHGFASEADYIH